MRDKDWTVALGLLTKKRKATVPAAPAAAAVAVVAMRFGDHRQSPKGVHPLLRLN